MTTPNIQLPELAANQAQPHVTVNTSLRYLDALVQLRVLAAQNSPPGAPDDGDRYIVGSSPAGDWVGHEDEVAVYVGTAWAFFAPSSGWLAFNAGTGDLLIYGTGSPVAWDVFSPGGGGGDVATDAIWTTKGDIAVATGAGAAVAVPATSNNMVLAVDSAEAAGVAWKTITSLLPVENVDIHGAYYGTPGNSEVVFHYVARDGMSIALEDLYGSVLTPPAAGVTLIVEADGVQVGTITISTGGSVEGQTDTPGTFELYPGSYLVVTNQASADGTLADFAFVIEGVPT